MTMQAVRAPLTAVEAGSSACEQEPEVFTACVHCGSDLAPRASEPFCCSGCRHVYRLLQESGLSRYYDLRGGRALAPVSLRSANASEPWIEQLLAELAAQAGAEDRVRRISLDVQGLQCAACVWLIEAVFKRAPGALSIRVNPALGQLTCAVEAGFSLTEFVHAVEDFGYRLGPARKQAAPAQRGLLLRTGVCLALAANTMFLSATTYFGLEHGALYDLVQNASFALATLSALIGGSYFVGRAYAGLKRGVFHLDLPIAVGMALAYAGSAWSLGIGRGQASYLDTVSVFIALMLVGRVLQERLIERNRRQLLASEGASALLARVVKGGHAELVPCAQVRSGDELLVCPGELVVVRAVLTDAAASCSLDWISGESEPRRFNQGDELVPGSINAGRSPLHATACAMFESSDLDLLLRDGAERDVRRAGDFWDSLARVYVLLVLLATAVGVALWWWSGYSPAKILELATATLVVTCPCAFGIATPLAYELGVARLRQLGLFVRDGTFFDRAARVRQIVFDKTGTLTTGSLVLKTPAALGTLQALERDVLYSIASQSGHPKSTAIARAMRTHDASTKLLPLEVHELPGVGLECWLDGVRYRLGSPSWAAPGQGLDLGPVFSADGRVLGVLETEEVARPDAAREVNALRDEGYRLWIASGDKREHVSELARTLNIAEAQAHGGLTPDGKVALLASIDRGDTLMLGDGINDGPALSRALCSGTPAIDRPFVPARTDFYYLTPGLAPVRTALHVARRVRHTVRGALVFATAYNVLVVGLAYAGVMVPWLAAVLMPASSLGVLAFTGISLSPRRILWKS
jgi:Cu2+-exporting ATPase